MLAAMLHAARRRQQEMTEREAGGESLWTEGFAERVRIRLRRALDRAWQGSTIFQAADFFFQARSTVLDQEGLTFLVHANYTDRADFEAFFLGCSGDDFPTALEAVMAACGDSVHAFAGMANQIFAEERVAWKIVDGQMIEIRSTEMHASVVEPALRLLHDPRFAHVDATYRKALDELSKGDGADAVTDAGAALQELLTALGCEGQQLRDQIALAKKRKLLAGHDARYLAALYESLNWVGADRSQTGESHHASDASRDDAWLIVHIVGAFIVRLASGDKRPSA